ncbi:MAG: PEP-CTERM sorting domain-containing protein [Phycisphaeraceae bacterium]|nr:PEP-CTERM sorting domain-containing protein [Phycisphaeraceae bacterium]
MKACSVLVAGVLALGSSAWAAYDYGDFVGHSVDFLGVSESSPTDSHALFGAPSVGGNNLHFMPGNNSSSSSNGDQDQTIGILTMDIVAKNGQEIRGVSILTLGTVSISGQTSTATFAAFENSLELLVGMTSYSDSNAQTFHASVPIWDGSTYIDFEAMGIHGITALSLTFTSDLTTGSESGSSSHIQSSLHSQEILVGVFIPEPASLGFLGLAGAALFFQRRR